MVGRRQSPQSSALWPRPRVSTRPGTPVPGRGSWTMVGSVFRKHRRWRPDLRGPAAEAQRGPSSSSRLPLIQGLAQLVTREGNPSPGPSLQWRLRVSQNSPQGALALTAAHLTPPGSGRESGGGGQRQALRLQGRDRAAASAAGLEVPPGIWPWCVLLWGPLGLQGTGG